MTLLAPVSLRSLFTLSAALSLAACTLPTKLGELDTADEAGDAGDTTGATTAGEPTTTAPPGGSDESGVDSNSGAGSCTPVELTRTPVSANVVLVLDNSASMVSDHTGLWDHDDDPNTPTVTRWSSLHQVVDTITAEFDASINFGAQLFPSIDALATYDDRACVTSETIDIAVAAENRAVILAGIPAASATNMLGGTPTAAGLTTALAHLKTLDPNVPRAILLVTDGAANCAVGAEIPPLFESYDEAVHDLVGDAFTIDGIPTYVVGVGIEDLTTEVVQDGRPDDTNAFDRLNQLATDGGKPRSDPDEQFFNTQNQIELAAALDEIAVDALTCLIALDAPLGAPEQTAIAVDGKQVPKVSDCASETGWVYTNPEGPFDAIELCGSACANLKLAGEAQVNLCMPG